MAYPRCVVWEEIGLDYNYDNSPPDLQKAVFARQLKQAIRLQRSLAIHTHETEDDTKRILKEEGPEIHPVRSLLLSLVVTLSHPT